MQVSVTINASAPRWMATRRRRAIAALALSAILLVPGLALASHNFADVPDGHTFHIDVSRLAGSGVTAGCGGGNFCPDAPVSRGQMAAFIGRAGGRIAFDEIGSFVAGGSAEVGTVSIRAGNVSGGTGLIFVEVVLGFYTYDDPSLATLRIDIFQNGSYVTNTWATLHDRDTLPYGALNVPLSATVAVPTGVDQEFTVVVEQLYGTADLTGYGSLTATYYPFQGNGSNPGLDFVSAKSPTSRDPR